MSGWYLHLVFAAGGGLGAVARHAMACWIPHRFPWATLLVNVLGCLVLGMASSLLLGGEPGVDEQHRWLVFGFCGGFTTFSSFAYQSLDLHRNETIAHAAANIVLSLLLCLVAYWLGASSLSGGFVQR